MTETRPILRRCARILGRWPDALCGVLLVVLAVLTVVMVVGRYTELYALVWAPEIVTWAFVWLGFLGAAIAVREEAHFRMTAIVSQFHRVAQTWFEILNALGVATLGILLLILGYQLVQISAGQQLAITGAPRSLVSAVVPVSGILIVYYAVKQTVSRIRLRISGQVQADRDQGSAAHDDDHSAKRTREGVAETTG